MIVSSRCYSSSSSNMSVCHYLLAVEVSMAGILAYTNVTRQAVRGLDLMMIVNVSHDYISIRVPDGARHQIIR